jgi:hypothetical protein
MIKRELEIFWKISWFLIVLSDNDFDKNMDIPFHETFSILIKVLPLKGTGTSSHI